MDAPLHKPCGTKHWSTQPCPLAPKPKKGGDAPETMAPSAGAIGQRLRDKPPAVSVKPAAGAKPKTPKCKVCGMRHTGPCLALHLDENGDMVIQKFDRTTYQREYMRKKRAADKARNRKEAKK